MAMTPILPAFGYYTPEAETPNTPSSWYDNETTTVNSATDPAHITTKAILNANGWKFDSNDGGTVDTYKRRRIFPELVLTEEIKDLTTAYNEGRAVNDLRFNDLILLYKSLITHSETEVLSLEADEDTFETLIDELITKFETDFDTHSDDVSGDFQAWGSARALAVSEHFINLLGKARIDLKNRGMYNTLSWNAEVVGNARERDVALLEVSDKVIERQVAEKNRLYQFKSDMRQRMVSSRSSLMNLLHSQGNARTNLRNQLVEALARFAERRNDGYPDLGSISTVVSDIGASNYRSFKA